MARRSLLAKRVMALVFDGLAGVLVVGSITTLAVTIAGPVASTPGLVVLGAWTAFVSLLALPALVVLHRSPPPSPLRERSALFASASWFGKTLWAGVVFGLSIVFGTVSGVVAARLSDADEEFNEILAAITGFALWPVVSGVAAFAFAVMCVRWLLDLTAIVDGGGAERVWAALEQRWFAPTSLPASYLRYRSGILWMTVSVIGRWGLVLTVITLGADIAITWAVLANV